MPMPLARSIRARPHRALALLGPLLAMALIAPSAAAARELSFAWEDPFSPAEKARLTVWVRETHQAVEALVGPFPMAVRIYMHRRDDAREPVPWAHTERYRGQGVHFHVDPRFSLDAFRDDWTAPHELSHLILPYVGRQDAWFSEGFASYMQYRVMQQMGVLSGSEAARRYAGKLDRARRRYDYPAEPFLEAAPKLRAAGRYPVMYWGGAAFFAQVDLGLQAEDTSLLAVLRDYLRCCREDRVPLPALLDQLDELAGVPAFSERYRRFAAEPGFPDG